MKEQIGNVILNYEFYKGEDLYSDGEVENWLLNTAKQQRMDEALRVNDVWPVLYHFTPIRKHILEWYPFKPNASVLEIGAGCGAITGALSKAAERIVCFELSKKRSLINAYQNIECDNVEIYVGNYEDITLDEKFDYITLIGVLEYAEYYTHGERPALEMLQQLRKMLKPDGHILIAIENRMGLKYLNGACEDHTGGLFDGVYSYSGRAGARTYTKNELESLLCKAGLRNNQWYYPFPDYKLPRMILSDSFGGNIGGFQSTSIVYDRTRYHFFDEEMVWDTLCRDGQLGYFANSFFIDAAPEKYERQIDSVIYSYFRKPEYQTRTIIASAQAGKNVIKTGMCQGGHKHLLKMSKTYDKLADSYKNVSVVPVRTEGDSVVFPYVAGTTLHNYLLDNCQNKDFMISNVNSYLDRILSFKEQYCVPFAMTDEFEEVFGHIDMDGVPATAVSNVDCIFSNIIVDASNDLYCFDYEWVFSFPVPIRFQRFRMLKSWFIGVKKYLDFEDAMEFFKAFGFTEQEVQMFVNMENHFVSYTINPEHWNYAYFGKYEKTKLDFDSITDSIRSLQEQNNDLQEQIRILHDSYKLAKNDVATQQEENEALKKKLAMHLKNEERLRKRLER